MNRNFPAKDKLRYTNVVLKLILYLTAPYSSFLKIPHESKSVFGILLLLYFST